MKWNLERDYMKFIEFVHSNSIIFNEYKTMNLSPITSSRRWGKLEQIPLTSFSPNTDLEKLLFQRRSVRIPKNKNLNFHFFSRLLKFSCGVSDKNKGFFTYPSPGGTYATTIFLYSEFIDEEILFRYNPGNHSLEKFTVVTKEQIFSIVNDKELSQFKNVIFLASSYDLIAERYKFATYRLLCQENGHIAQNILLYLTHTNVNGVPIGGFLDNDFKKYVSNNLDLHYVIVMG